MSENEPNVRTIEEYLMLKLLELEEPQRPSDLLLAAWHSHPHVFGIAGYPTQHPDARHLQALATIRQEWLVQEEDRYALTKEGQVTALAIRDGIPLPKPIESRTEEEFYKLFDEHATIVKPKTLWEEYADQLRDGFIASANRFGFTIELADGDRTITFGDEGLTEKVYNYFAPLCKDDWDRAALAKGVVENFLPKEMYEWDYWDDLQAAWRTVAERHTNNPGGTDEDWIPNMVGRIGFESLADQVKKAAIENSEARLKRKQLEEKISPSHQASSRIEENAEWSQPISPTEWAHLFGVSYNTMLSYLNGDTLRVMKLSVRRYQIAMDTLPKHIKIKLAEMLARDKRKPR